MYCLRRRALPARLCETPGSHWRPEARVGRYPESSCCRYKQTRKRDFQCIITQRCAQRRPIDIGPVAFEPMGHFSAVDCQAIKYGGQGQTVRIGDQYPALSPVSSCATHCCASSRASNAQTAADSLPSASASIAVEQPARPAMRAAASRARIASAFRKSLPEKQGRARAPVRKAASAAVNTAPPTVTSQLKYTQSRKIGTAANAPYIAA